MGLAPEVACPMTRSIIWAGAVSDSEPEADAAGDGEVVARIARGSSAGVTARQMTKARP